MNAIPSLSSAPNLALIRASEIGTKHAENSLPFADSSKERQKWLKDPREIVASNGLHQQTLVNGADIAWDHTNCRYQWQHDGTPIARPLSHGNLTYNQETQWWERNGSPWQPEKKTEGGRQTAVGLRHLGVVVQPRISRFFGRAKTLLRLSAPFQQTTRTEKEDRRGVPTIVSEVTSPETKAQKKFDLRARSHIIYTHKQPFRLLRALSRKSCRHPSTCNLHSHINVDLPESIDLPLVEEPEKLRASQSAFTLRACQQLGHKHLSHEQDPCFSNTKGEGVDAQNREDIIRHVVDLAATGTRAEELERVWQREEEREQQEEMLMAMPEPRQKENRPPSVSAQTLFHNAAKSLQQHSVAADLPGRQERPLYSDTTKPFHLRGGAGSRRYTGQPWSWSMREWFTGIRREPVRVIHGEPDDDNDYRGNRGRHVRQKVMHAHEAGITEDEFANLPVLSADEIEDMLGRHEGVDAGHAKVCAHRDPNWMYRDERGRRLEAEYVGTVSDDTRRRIERLDTASRSRSRSRFYAYAHSESPRSIEVVRDVNIQGGHHDHPGDAPGRAYLEVYGGGPDNDLAARRAWAQWDGRTQSSGANVLTRTKKPWQMPE